MFNATIVQLSVKAQTYNTCVALAGLLYLLQTNKVMKTVK